MPARVPNRLHLVAGVGPTGDATLSETPLLLWDACGSVEETDHKHTAIVPGGGPACGADRP